MLDLDAWTYERRPGPTSRSFPFDNETLPLGRVELWPVVGQQMMVWFDDPVTPDTLDHYRVCSTISSIRRDEDADEDVAG